LQKRWIFLRSPARGNKKTAFRNDTIRAATDVEKNIKGKDITCTDLWGSRRIRLPELLENWYIKLARLSAIHTGRVYPQEILLVLTPRP
jgi:hypothetical protein